MRKAVEAGVGAGSGLGASMEPQLEGCGKIGGGAAYDIPLELQWSRNLRVAESNLADHIRRFIYIASMEPQLEGCGKRPVPCR